MREPVRRWDIDFARGNEPSPLPPRIMQSRRERPRPTKLAFAASRAYRYGPFVARQQLRSQQRRVHVPERPVFFLLAPPSNTARQARLR
jgi:hypothetical protein